MKANRKFVNDVEAVSPVIATILMVAITVVLAATVFVLLQGIDSGEAPTALGFDREETTDRITFNSGEGDWANMYVKVSGCTQAAGSGTQISLGNATAYQNDAAVYAGGKLNAADTAATSIACGSASEVRVTVTSPTTMTAGDFLALCAGPAAIVVPPTNVRVQVRDGESNSIIFDEVYAEISECTA